MIATTFHAMGTAWWIRTNRPARSTRPHDDAGPQRHLAQAEALVRDLEAKLSRFRPRSSLSLLNATRDVTCPTLAAVTKIALEIQAATDGAFDPTLGAELVALGYDRTFEAIRRRPRRGPLPVVARSATVVSVDGERVRLEGPGSLDLGGIAKGYAVDRVLEFLLERGATSVLIDGGGDLRGAGPSVPVGIGDDLVIETRHGAIATSSTLERRWLDPREKSDPRGQYFHHIIDPATGLSSDSPIVIATVVAADAASADALATALLVAPEVVIAQLAARFAHALVRDRDGRWWTSPGAPFVAPQDAPRTSPPPTSQPLRSARPARDSRLDPRTHHPNQTRSRRAP